MVEKAKAQNSSGRNMETQEAPNKRSPGGILKKRAPARPQLETVSEYAVSQMEHKDSSLSVADSEKSVNNQPQEELEKFKILCEGVQNTLALFQTSLVELLALKDELLQHALPPSLLVKMTLVTGKLFRSSSDLSVPITELVRMVKLYSAPWEAKSTALKKLHEDYENKQRQLNVALQKLVLVGIQSERMAQERRVMNWEKLFSKTMSSRAHGYRWKFLIDSFKKKAKNGEVYIAASTDEEAERERERSKKELDGFRRRAKHRDTAAKKIMRESLVSPNSLVSVPAAARDSEIPKSTDDKDEFDNDVVSDPEDLKMLTFEDETPESKVQIPDMAEKQPMFAPALTETKRQPSPPSKPKQGLPKPARPRIQFLGASDDEEEKGERNESLNVAAESFLPPRIVPQIRFSTSKDEDKKKRPKRSGVKFLSFSDDDDSDEKADKEEKPPPRPMLPRVAKADASCWTQEPEYEKYLHVRVYRPVCKKVTEPFCSIAFCGVMLKTAEFEAPVAPVEEESRTVDSETKDTRRRPSSRTSLNDRRANKTPATASKPRTTSPAPQTLEAQEQARFEEAVFKLPDESGHEFGKTKTDISKEPLRIAVHPGMGEAMIAMATANYEDLEILDDPKASRTVDSSSAQQYPLTSVISDREMPFNSPCGHVPIKCYETRVERPKHLVKETETATFEELLNAEIEARKEAEQASQQSVEQASKPAAVYTEDDISFLRDQHAQEVLAIQEEYEKRLNELAQGLSFTQEDENGRFVSVATSPILLRSPTPLGSRPPDRAGRTPQPPPTTKSPIRKARPRIPNLPDWGKDLPDDFLVRLAMFAENSVKYHQELADRTRKAMQQKYELQMAVQNRLTAPNEEQNEAEVCLPAVFMPTRAGHVYSPKAHSYFHPPGSTEGRLTQPPSIFKLPFLPTESQVSVLNLFEAGQRYSASAHWSLPDQSRASTLATPHSVSQTAPPPPTACGWRSPSPPFPDRAKTR